MKKISLCTHVLILSIFVSCNTDDVPTEETTTQSKEFQAKKTSIFSKNLSSYDTLGDFHNLVLETYVSKNYNYTTLEDIFGQIKLLTEDLGNTTSLVGLAPLEDLTYMVMDPAGSLDTFIANSTLTALAKASFSNFVSSLVVVENSDYDALYNTIVDYELVVQDDASMSSEDKKIIFTTTTLLKYTCTYRKRRKDKDWEVSVGNKNAISAKFQGALYDTTTAVIMSITMEIYSDINQ